MLSCRTEWNREVSTGFCSTICAQRLPALRTVAILLVIAAAAAGAEEPDVAWFGPGHSLRLSSCGISPDGSLWLSGGHFTDSTVKVWNAADGRLLRTFRGGLDRQIFGGFAPVHASADNRYVLSIGEASAVVVWSLADGARQFQVHALTYDAVFSADGQHVIAAHNDGRIAWYRIPDGALVRTWNGPQGLRAVAASRDGAFVVTGGLDGRAHVWRVPDGQLLHTLDEHTSSIASVAVSPDNRWIVTGGHDGVLLVWKADSGERSHAIQPSFNFIQHVNVSADSSRVLATGFSNDVEIWELATGTPVAALPSNATAWAAFTPDGRSVLSAEDPASVRLWNVDTRSVERTLTHHTFDIIALAFDPAGRWLASGSYDGTVRFWNAADGAPLETIMRQTGIVASMAVSRDGSLVATGGGDKLARIWNTSDGSLRRQWQPHAWTVGAVAFSPDGRTLATGDASTGAVTVWNVDGGAVWSAASAGGTTSLTFTPDGAHLLVGKSDGVVRIRSASDGALVRTLNAHAQGVASVAVSPDGQTIGSGGADRTAKLWNLADGRRLHTLTGHTHQVGAVAFSPDGGLLASTGLDLTVRLWRVSDATPLVTYDGEMGGLDGNAAIAFSPDGALLAYGRSDGTVVAARNPFAAPPLVCEDVRRMVARCTGGRLKIAIRLTDKRHDGQSLEVDVDGDRFDVPVQGRKGKLRLKGLLGEVKVRLTRPAECGVERTTDC